MDFNNIDESTFRRLVNDEIADIRGRLANLDKRLCEAEEKPQEILQAIERIWNADPEKETG
jgi:hypothetical protein